MGLYYRNLTPEVRLHMLKEAELGFHYFSNYLKQDSHLQWISLLNSSLEAHDDNWLATNVTNSRLLVPVAFDKNGKRRTIGVSDARTLAEGEFNRFYLRGLCAYCIENNIPKIVIYRGKEVLNPRPESEAKIGADVSVHKLLDDLRSSDFVNIAEKFSVSSGPNSGLTAGIRIASDPIIGNLHSKFG